MEIDIDVDENESVASIASEVEHDDILTELDSSRTGLVTITRETSIAEILVHLSHHGCINVTSELDVSRSDDIPVSTGGFVDIYRGVLRDGTPVSLKCLRQLMYPEDEVGKQIKRAAREIYVWSKLKHPNVLALIGVAEYRNLIAMVSPWMENGNLGQLLAYQPQIDRCSLCVQIADGVAYLHSQGIVHGDIKGLNILFSQDFTPKLTGFGGPARGEYTYTLQFTNTTTKGDMSIRWTPPEVLLEGTGRTTEADVYSLGMTILEVITGSVPYVGTRELTVILKIEAKVHPTRPEKYIPTNNEQADLLWSLLTSCWAYDPRGRPNAAQVRDTMKKITSEGLSGVMTR